MTRVIRYGLFFLAIASPALAGTHYLEVWNPPEARDEVQPVRPVGKAPRHRRASVHAARGQLRHRIAAAAPGPKASVAAVEHGARAPRYEDIPRQLTPEGNVLRVDGRRAQARVDR